MTMPALWIIALVLHTGMDEAQRATSQQTWQGFVTLTSWILLALLQENP